MRGNDREAMNTDIILADVDPTKANFATLQRQFDELRRIVEQRNTEIAELKAEAVRLNARLAYTLDLVEEQGPNNKTAKPLF